MFRRWLFKLKSRDRQLILARTRPVIPNPSSPIAAPQIAETQRAAKSLGIEVLVLNTTIEEDFVPAFEKLSQRRAHALLISGDKLYTARRDQLVGAIHAVAET